MQSIQFWRSWASEYKRIGFFIGLAFAIALLFFWWSWYHAPAPALTWMNVQEQELVQVPIHSFQHGLLELTIQGDTYLIFDRLLGEPLQPNLLASYFFLAALLIGMVMIITLITTLSRFWYLLGMGLFILFVVGFRLEIIQMFGLTNKIFTISVLALYCLPSFYFQFFKSATSFKVRLLVFFFITLLVGITIVSFATVPMPLLHLSVTGVAAGIVISIIFILMVAHEIIASFVFIVSQSSRQSKSLNHFLIITAVYMINLALAYAFKIGMIDWNFMYIHFYLLISISGILGVWGFRQRQPQYENIIEANPFGVYLFLSIGAIAFAAIGYFIGTANDSALVTINDAIIYSHLGYGLIFTTYIISNFFAMLGENLPVYKVLYSPRNMPYFTFRFGGLIATLAFVFFNTWQVPVQNAFSAYYNAGGDLYQTVDNPKFAEAFYQQASIYGYLNHHSNYAIANIEARKNFNTIKERNYYDRANQRRPTEFSQLNYSQTYQQNRQWLESILSLKKGLNEFPESGPLKNTLGLVYSKINLIDSALFFLQAAMDSKLVQEEAEANFIGVAAKNRLPINADSLYRLIASDNKGVQSNALAFANVQGTKIELEVDIKNDSTLDLFSASLLNNYMINHLGELDSAFITRAVEIAKMRVNSNYSESILYTGALALYVDGQVSKAFKLLEETIVYSENEDKYNTILAMWSLENRAPNDALGFIEYVLNQKDTEALPISATALTEIGEFGTAMVRWDTLRDSKDSVYHEYATNMMHALSVSAGEVSTLTDEAKYLYASYRIPVEDSIRFYRATTLIESEELRARAILYRSQKLFELDELDAAIQTFQKLRGLQLSDKNLYDQIIHFELEMLAAKRDLRGLANQINNQSVEFSGRWKSEKVFYSALLNQLSGDTIATSAQFRWLAFVNPYHEDAVIAAADYFRTQDGDQLLPYVILTEALHANPHSAKLLKSYSIEAAQRGFDEYAQDGLERLRHVLPARMLRNFLTQNQDTFAQVLQ